MLDITNIEQVKDVSARIRREVGDVNILINNAGTVNQAKLLLDLTEQEISRLFQVSILSKIEPDVNQRIRVRIRQLSQQDWYADE